MREAVGSVLRYDLPVTATHYLELGVRWRTLFREVAGSRDRTALEQPSRTYAAGQRYAERWNAAVFGPALPGRGHATRTGDYLQFGVPLFSDQDGHAGHSVTDQARTTLYRDGTQIATSNVAGSVDAVVPPATSGYRLVTTADRGTVSGFSTKVDATWSFDSANVPGWFRTDAAASSRSSPHLPRRRTSRCGQRLPTAGGTR